jgi:pilus assembly protein CpaB
MNMTRILVLVGAVVAAGFAALLARGLVGGQNKASAAPPVELTEVLVAARGIEVGTKLSAADVKWMGWPKSAIDPAFMTKEAQPKAIEDAADGAIARSPLSPGQPLTGQNIIKGNGGGFMAAVLTPGKRAVGVKVSAERGAGGFILPNDRVDVILTRKTGQDGSGAPNFQAATVLTDIRVLAVDQTADEEGDSKAIVGKTATLELSEREAETIALAEAMGDLSLTLRSLSKAEPGSQSTDAAPGKNPFENDGADGVTVMRYGMPGKTVTGSSE